MTASPPPPPPLWWRELLVARRGPWNAAAAAARARGARTGALAAALREVGGALATAGPPSPALEAVADAVVPAALDLVAQRRWSGAPRRALLAVPALAAHCGRDGERAGAVVADLLGAAGRVQRWGDAGGWLARLVAAATTPGALAAADSAGSPDPAHHELLRRLGVLAAWRSGCARLRRAALESAPRVPADAACAALSVPAVSADRLAGLLRRHAADPWWWPGRPEPVGVVARVGGFRGFGGPWPRPPRVLGPLGGDGTAWDVVTDDPSDAAGPGSRVRWRVLADVHGVAVHRWTPGTRGTRGTPEDRPRTGPPPVRPPWDDDATGWAAAGRTVLLSRAHSHLLDVVVAR